MPHDFFDYDHKRRVKSWVQALLATVDKDTPVKYRPCDISKEVQFLKSGKACRFDGIPNECLRNLPRRALVHLTHLFNHCLHPVETRQGPKVSHNYAR
jgi:hypothetical protein